MPEPFDALAADLARFQAAHVPGYARLCAARGVDPGAITRASEAPAVPTDAFKLARVFAFDERDAAVTFRTSGTTRRRARRARDAHGRLVRRRGARLRRVRCSRAGSRARGSRPSCVIGPSDVEAPDSSLSHMCALFARAFGDGAGEPTFFVRGGVLEVDALRRAPGVAAAASVPALVLATSFALVHWLDALGRRIRAAPAGQPRHADGRLQGAIARGLRGGRCAARSRGRSRSTSAPSSASTG